MKYDVVYFTQVHFCWFRHGQRIPLRSHAGEFGAQVCDCFSVGHYLALPFHPVFWQASAIHVQIPLSRV